MTEGLLCHQWGWKTFSRSAHATDPAIGRRSRKFSRKFVENFRFWSLLGRSGSSGKSRATRCQNSSLLRRLATFKTQKKTIPKKFDLFGPVELSVHYSLPFSITRRWPTPPPHKKGTYRFGRAQIRLAEARFSQHKLFFRNFRLHGPQNRCIWSKN